MPRKKLCLPIESLSLRKKYHFIIVKVFSLMTPNRNNGNTLVFKYPIKFLKIGKSLALLATIALIVPLTAGCTRRIADLTVLSSKNVDLYPLDLRGAHKQHNVKGTDGRWWFLVFPLGFRPNLEDALEDALNNGRGDIMTSAVIYTRAWHILLIGHEQFIVKGDVFDSSHFASRPPNVPPNSRRY
jgi:hypothetical protein